MKAFLEKISWATRRWNYTFRLFELHLHDMRGSWGFSLFSIDANFETYSLLSIEFRLPNKTTVQRLIIDSWDILFLKQFLWRKYDQLSDEYNIEGQKSLKLKFLKRIFN